MIAGTLAIARRLTESRMTDTCKITRPGEKFWNETTGSYEQTPVTVYQGKCRVRHPSLQGEDVDAGSQLLTKVALEVHLPISVVGVLPSDTIVITKSGTRPEQVGRRFTVHSAFDGSQTTALRYRVEVADER